MVPGPDVEIEKGDTGAPTGTTIVNDADTMGAAAQYAPGETRTIVFSPRNTGDEALVEVVVTDRTVSGGHVQAMSCVFSGETTPTVGVFAPATGTWTVTWAASFAPPTPASWAAGTGFACSATLTVTAVGGMLAPGESFFCDGTLTLGWNAKHEDTVTVTANVVVPEVDEDGVPTGKPARDGGAPVLATDAGGRSVVVGDDDPFYAFTPLLALPQTGAHLGAAGVALAAVLLGVLLLLAARRRLRGRSV